MDGGRAELREGLFTFRGDVYPEYLRTGNACQHIAATALHFCKGRGVDVGAGRWALPGAMPVDRISGHDATMLPGEDWDYIFSSHLLEHLSDPVAALAHWKDRLRTGGVLFLYLPHYDQKYWRPSQCRKHRHAWYPNQVVDMLLDVGFVDLLHSERDLCWSFSVVGWKP